MLLIVFVRGVEAGKDVVVINKFPCLYEVRYKLPALTELIMYLK